MDEYYCPNCGASLNDQYGFDPSCGTWTCTECGKLLMDDDVYEGDSYEGVAWFCDGCGVLLNRQLGFSDSYGSWVCTECGHRNGTTEDDILEEDDGPECPNCGAYLKKQFCFSDYKDDWECTECGAYLHHVYSSDPYEIVDDEDEKIECPNCGDDLTEQFCFENYLNDWICTLCGAHLHRDFCDDSYSVVNEDDEDDNGCDVTDVPLSHNPATLQKSSDVSASHEKQKLSKGELRKKRIKAFFFRKKKVEIGYDCTELLQKNIVEVQTAIHNRAFNNIKIISVKDIYIGSQYKEGEVEQVVVGGNSFFDAADMVPYDTEIVITYHEKKEITIPFSPHSLRKKNYMEIRNQLLELGFTEVEERPIRDLITGWINKNGSIEKVSIGGEVNFKRNSIYKYDINIVIEYHTFKK